MATDPQKASHLLVPNVPNWKQFLKNAREVWGKTHGEKKIRRGRPSIGDKVWSAAWDLSQAGKFDGKTTQYKMVQLVRKSLGAEAPSKRAILNHVKAFQIVCKLDRFIPVPGPTRTDMEFLKKTVPGRLEMLIYGLEVHQKSARLSVEKLSPEEREQPPEWLADWLNAQEKTVKALSYVLPAKQTRSYKNELKFFKSRLTAAASSKRRRKLPTTKTSSKKSRFQ